MPSLTLTAAQRRLRLIADGLEPALRDRVWRALLDLQRSVPAARLEAAIRGRDPFALHDLASSLPARLRPSLAVVTRAVQAGGQAARAALAPAVRVHTRFDGRNVHASEAARETGARLVREVSEATRAGIRRAVADAFADGVTPRDLAAQVRPLIGLTSRQAAAVSARQAQAIAAGASRAKAAAQARAYAEKLLRARAETIARTEIIRATTEGQLAAWREAVSLRLLGVRSQKLWIVTDDDRLCPHCRRMAEKQVPLNDKFKGPYGPVSGPPLHPRCRCAIAVVPVSASARRAA